MEYTTEGFLPRADLHHLLRSFFSFMLPTPSRWEKLPVWRSLAKTTTPAFSDTTCQSVLETAGREKLRLWAASTLLATLLVLLLAGLRLLKSKRDVRAD